VLRKRRTDPMADERGGAADPGDVMTASSAARRDVAIRECSRAVTALALGVCDPTRVTIEGGAEFPMSLQSREGAAPFQRACRSIVFAAGVASATEVHGNASNLASFQTPDDEGLLEAELAGFSFCERGRTLATRAATRHAARKIVRRFAEPIGLLARKIVEHGELSGAEVREQLAPYLTPEARSNSIQDVTDLTASLLRIRGWLSARQWRTVAFHEAAHAVTAIVLCVGEVRHVVIRATDGGGPGLTDLGESWKEEGRTKEERAAKAVVAGAGIASEWELSGFPTLSFMRTQDDRGRLWRETTPFRDGDSTRGFRLEQLVIETGRALVHRHRVAIEILAHILIENSSLEGPAVLEASTPHLPEPDCQASLRDVERLAAALELPLEERKE
jgi:hypothetical protein